MRYVAGREERMVWMHGCVLRSAQQNPLRYLLKVANSSLQSFSSQKKKKKVKQSSGLPFKGRLVLSVLNAPVPLKKMLLLCFKKNNKSYRIPLNSASVGNIGRKDTERFKVLVWRKRFWIKQFYVILQVVWAIILYVRLYHCSLECSYNTDLIMHRKKISHLLDSFLLFKSRKEQKGSYFLKEIVRFYCRKVAACAELEL